jgi:hypothetical protein
MKQQQIIGRLQTLRISPNEFWCYRLDERPNGDLRIWGQAHQGVTQKPIETLIPGYMVPHVALVTAVQLSFK